MIRAHLVSKMAATVCLVCAPWTWLPLAAQAPPLSSADNPARAPLFAPSFHPPSRFTLTDRLTNATLSPTPPAKRALFADSGWGREHWDHHSGARAAIILGSMAAIAGGALLIYANRPDCSANHAASGCGYGTKVTGGALLAGGLVSVTLGAVTWH